MRWRDRNPIYKCVSHLRQTSISFILTEEWVVFHSAIKIGSHENKPMRNFYKEFEELQWNLKYLGGNKHTRINRHWGKNGTASQPCTLCALCPLSAAETLV